MTTHLKNGLKMIKQVKGAIRQHFTFPGCYPLSIITSDGAALCPNCAKENFRAICQETLVKGWRGGGWTVAGVEVLYEGGNYCDQCSTCLDAYPSE